MIRSLRRFFRLFRFLLHTLSGLLCALAARFSRQPEIWSQRWFTGLLHILNVRVQCRGGRDIAPALVAGNHQSWLDIALLVSLKPVIFVSKAEVARWPLIGWMARAGDTLFIERGAHGTQDLNRQIAAFLAQGRCVVIFPEATTTRGPGVRRFQPRLFAGAIQQQVPVLPFALRYGQACVPYVDQQTLVANLWNLLGEAHIDARIDFGPTLNSGDSRDAIARSTQAWVESSLLDSMPTRAWPQAEPTRAQAVSSEAC